jgi:hypothetical protein
LLPRGWPRVSDASRSVERRTEEARSMLDEFFGKVAS